MSAVDAAVEPHAGRSWQTEVDRLRAEARSRFLPFVESMNPGARERDRRNEPVPHDLFARAAEVGLLGFSLPTEVGGEGRDKFEWGIVMEEMGTVSRDPSFATLLDISIETLELILRSGRPDLVDRYAGRLASGRWIATAASYESRDPFDYLSTAEEADGGWVLNGRKGFVAAGRIADLFVVYVRDPVSNDLLGFLVERGDPGVRTSGLETMGVRTLGLGQIGLCDVRLPAERLVWRADALSQMNSYARNRRLMTAASLVGTMDTLVARCVERLGTRIRGGRPVLDHPNVERAIGEMHVAIETSRAIVHRALDATRGDRDGYYDVLATVAKHHLADSALRVGELILNLQGGEGYMSLQPWERYMRDMLGMIGGQGAQEILLIQLGQRSVVAMDGRQASEEAAERRVAKLAASHWALATLGAAQGGAAHPRAGDVLAAAGVSDLAPATGADARLRAAHTFVERAGHGVLDGDSLEVLADPADPDTPLGRLERASCAFAVLAAALETRLLDELAVVRDHGAVGDRLGAPAPVVERMLDVLAEAGLVRVDGGRYAVHPGLEPALVSRVRRAQLEEEARAALARRAGPLVHDPGLDRLRDGTAAAFCDVLFERHVAALEGLHDLLVEPAPRALVVGPGSAALAAELCRWSPALAVVGLEPHDADAARERGELDRALADRVQIRAGDAGAAAGEGPFALGCLATGFHARDAVSAQLAGLHRGLADGGWAVLLMPTVPRNALGAASARLRTAVAGGDPALDDEGHDRLLREAGFALTRALPEVPGRAVRLIAARKLGAEA